MVLDLYKGFGKIVQMDSDVVKVDPCLTQGQQACMRLNTVRDSKNQQSSVRSNVDGRTGDKPPDEVVQGAHP